MSIEPRRRKVRILATLGPSSADPEMLSRLFHAGADAFRVNMSHGSHADHKERIAQLRAMEKQLGRPMTILADLQGPKIRVGTFEDGPIHLKEGDRFVLDRDDSPGSAERVCLPHPEVFVAVEAGQRLLLNDGKLVLKIESVSDDRIETVAQNSGELNDRKGVNVPDAVIPLPALTDKDRRDLDFALDQGVDWIALSFVQRPDDVAEARRLIAGRAALMAKIEKPRALDRLDEILDLCDGLMVARGDLGVELPPQKVPRVQKEIVELARMAGKPVVVATQMLDSMVSNPAPTRAEVSDVANTIYEGVDTIMLSAETAAGSYPVEAVRMMNAIALEAEADPMYQKHISFTETSPQPTTADAISSAAGSVVRTVDCALAACFTTSGSTARRASRERLPVPLLVLTPSRETARRLGLLWGIHAVTTRDVSDFEEMVGKARRMAVRTRLGETGDRIVVMAGVPFGTPGSTNVLHIARISGDELKGYER
ncbi:pyruvate kinase [Pacificimonas flava]|uniref:Pyruvate kinase n=2 Tax=Pacificimonas TaxID=1960290 RepID=A0A219B2L3_9SPHN|nr:MULTISPECIES: pyruvate kinase [Pacificimonas]MBZ6377975.1 pyruvate kinase [Pacificimonas aurantium]OWV32376.1 pyruvate kinase [Pacificimonas flava]